MTDRLSNLRTFLRPDGLSQDEGSKMRILQSNRVPWVVCHCLGPEGTNIAQAAAKWIRRMNIRHKAEILLHSTPEECLEFAKRDPLDVLGVFWTCAVYINEARLFFTNPDVLPFYFWEVMDLDVMQLATTEARIIEIRRSGNKVPIDWKIASHPSPKFLVESLGCEMVLANSNAHAAELCASGECHACITTETARRLNNLTSLHRFGSPSMVFFGGITSAGASLIAGVSL